MGLCNPWWYRWFHSENSDNLFLNCVRQYGVAPRLLRMDNGTENTSCKHLQSFFTNDKDSYLNTVSIRNQRIEALRLFDQE